MHWRSTAWLFTATLAVALFILLVERPARLAQTQSHAPPPVLPGFDPASVTSIEIRPAGKPSFRLVRTNALWFLPPPTPHPAQQSLPNGLLQRLASLRGRSILSPEELLSRPQAPAEFGLNPPQLAVSLFSPSGTTELTLGVRSIQGNHVYCQIGGIAGIFAAEAALADLLPTDASAWRETTLIPLDRLNFDRIRIAPQGAPFTLARDPTNHIWSLIEPRIARADPTRVGVLIRQLGFLQISDFIAATSAPPPELAGLKPPRLTVTLTRGNEEVFRVGFGGTVSNSTALYAQRPGDTELCTVPADSAGLLRLSYKDLLDRRILRFDPATIRDLEVAGPNPFRVVLQPSGWRLQPGDLPADPDLVDHLLTSLSVLEILDIAKEVVTDLDLSTYGLAPPATRILLRTTPGNTNAPATILETGALKENRLFARVQGEQPVYLLSPADLEAVPTAPWQLRNRTLWQFDAPHVAAITVRHADLEWALRRQNPQDWSMPPGLKNEINPFALDEALHVAGASRAISWVASGTNRHAVFGIGRGPELILQLRGQPASTTNQIHLSFGKRSPAGHRYVASTLADGSTLTFEWPGDASDDLLRELGVADSPP